MTHHPAFPKMTKIDPPSVEKRPVRTERHGVASIDDYAWLRDEKWQDVLRDSSVLSADIRGAIEAENKYYETLTDELEPLRKKLFKEMRGRIKEDESSVPAKDGDWAYWSKYNEGGEYPTFVRAPVGGSAEQKLFEGDHERGDAKFFDIGAIAHSPDHRLIAYAVDRLGSEYFSIGVRDIETGKDYDDVIESADDGGAVWSADSKSFFYVERDDNQRPKRVKFHRLGDRPETDKVIYEEPDDGYFLQISKSQSGAYIFITSGSQITSEVRYIRAGTPEMEPILIAPRETGVEYYPDHHGNDFYIMTNADGAVDFKIVKTAITNPGRNQWEEWRSHHAGTQIVTITTFKDYIVRLERENALPRIVIATYSGEEHVIAFDEAAYSLSMSAGYEYDTKNLRFTFESPSTPRQTFDYDMASRQRKLRKTQTVPSGHDPSLYAVERMTALASDGAEIPVTIIRLRSTPLDGSAPALLYGYGSYGISMPSGFSTNILPLVDRGAVYAVAHIRGGADKGRQWYLDGKLKKKMNTFTDFITVGETLIEKGYTAKKKIVIFGGSAGGLLVGASVNLRPDLFGGVIAAVPFVDVINTISDADLPLTPPEWEEWGNPITSADDFQLISTYSPYDNIADHEYPPIMATGGLTDYRVTYWEPTKWIAKLRDQAKGGPFVLRMNMGAGHGGSAARFEQLDERAHLYAFALRVWGLDGQEPVVHKP